MARNSADYLAPNARTRKPDIIGIWVDPPADSVMDLAPGPWQPWRKAGC